MWISNNNENDKNNSVLKRWLLCDEWLRWQWYRLDVFLDISSSIWLLRCVDGTSPSECRREKNDVFRPSRLYELLVLLGPTPPPTKPNRFGGYKNDPIDSSLSFRLHDIRRDALRHDIAAETNSSATFSVALVICSSESLLECWSVSGSSDIGTPLKWIDTRRNFPSFTLSDGLDFFEGRSSASFCINS